MPFHCEATSTASQRPHTVDTASIRPPVGGKSRKVWHKQSPQKEGQSQSPLAHFSQLAKYTQHHLPDVNSRCASVLVSQTCAGYYTATTLLALFPGLPRFYLPFVFTIIHGSGVPRLLLLFLVEVKSSHKLMEANGS